MNTSLRKAYQEQLLKAKTYYQQELWAQCFYHLENAHVLGQRSIGTHCESHWWMLKLAVKRRSLKEILAQCIRLLASPIITPFWVPLGNTGGGNVSAIKPMPLRDELKPYFLKKQT